MLGTKSVSFEASPSRNFVQTNWDLRNKDVQKQRLINHSARPNILQIENKEVFEN